MIEEEVLYSHYHIRSYHIISCHVILSDIRMKGGTAIEPHYYYDIILIYQLKENKKKTKRITTAMQ